MFVSTSDTLESRRSTHSRDITLSPVTPNDHATLGAMVERYVAELGPRFGLAPAPDGRFAYPLLPLYLSETSTHRAFVVRVEKQPIGFALVTRGSPATHDPMDLDVAEFFIAPAHRRTGAGRAAAFLLWDRIPGRWVVRVSSVNSEAIPFWEGAVRAYSDGDFTEARHSGRTHPFHVLIFSNDPTRL